MPLPKPDFVTFAGADNRYKMLGDTFRVIRHHFDRVHLLDTGSTDNTPDLKNEFDLEYFRQEGLNNGNWGPTIELALSHLRVGQWFVYMDSDERPSPHMLAKLPEYIEYLQNADIGQGVIYNIFHLNGRHHEFEGGSADQIAKYEAIGILPHKSPPGGIFCKGAINRYHHNTVSTNGPHFGINSHNRRSAWMPTFYNHYKVTNQMETSWIMCSWPYCHYHGLPKNSKEEKLFLQLAKKHNMPTGQELYAKAIAGQLPAELITAASAWKDSKYELLRAYYNWIHVYEFKLENQIPYCGDVCCSYDNGIQY